MGRVLVQLARTTEQYKTTHYVLLGWLPGAWELATWALGTSELVLGLGGCELPTGAWNLRSGGRTMGMGIVSADGFRGW